jgi:5,10-methylenetetrahydrofolate reductase
MANPLKETVAIHLPRELLERMEVLKQDRREDRDKSVEELIQQMCQSFVRVREMGREELARMEEINRSYEAEPYDCRDDYYAEGENKEQAG